MASRKMMSKRSRAVTFRVVITRKPIKPEPNVVLLERDLWSDFGYRCSFRIFVAERGKHRLIGTWKILDRTKRGERRTELSRAFDALEPSFISLGQNLAAYENIAALPRRFAVAILNSLNDVVFKQMPDLNTVDGFERAMVRFAEADEALHRGRLVLERAGLAEPSGPEHPLPEELQNGIVRAHRPVEQSFASTLDEISRIAFRISPSDENFRTLLERLRQSFDTDQIRELLGGELGLGTRLQLASLEQ